MAIGADFDVQPVALDGRASLEIVAAGAVYGYSVIIGVNTGFHEAPFVRVRSARLTHSRGRRTAPLKRGATAASLGRDANPNYTAIALRFPNSVATVRSLVSLEVRSVCGANFGVPGLSSEEVSYIRLFSSDGILRRSALAGSVDV